MKRVAFIVVNFIFCVTIKAQTDSFTLERCIDTALKNNLQVNLAGNQAERDDIGQKQAKLNMLPSLNGSASHGWNFGRSIDNTTNSYADNNFYSGGYSLGGDATLFKGLNLQRTAKQRMLDYKASKMSWQQQKDDITLNIILAYLQMMNSQDLLVQTKNQAALSQQQVTRLGIMDSTGAIAPSELFDVQGQLANDQASIINAERDVENARIAICNWMNIPYQKELVFARIETSAVLQKTDSDASTAYATALDKFAQIKAYDFRLQSAEMGVKVARSALFPTLSLGYGTGSSYAQFNGSINDQLSNNSNKNVGLTLSVPIFNSLQARNNVKLAKINLKDEKVQNKTVKTELQQNIEGAYNNMEAAFERYKRLTEQVDALQKSYKAAEAKFNVGQGSSVDYLIVKNKLDQANISLIGGKYEYLFRQKIYNYYQGISDLN